MPEIVLTEQAREHLDSIGLELERLQSETAILVGEVGWRQIASSGESGERELVEHGGFTAEEIPLLRSLAEGREPVRATIVFSEDEEAEIQHEALSLQEEDARNNRLQYEIAALFERAEEVATAAAVERTAARRQYSASREKKITKFLRGLRDKSPEMMRETGQLGKEELDVAGRAFAVGDRVMTTRNARKWLGVLNGTQGEVASIDRCRGKLTLRTDGERDVILPTSYLQSGHLTHAYAMTGHKAQGMTTARCFALGDDTLYKEWGYTALSRGKKENRLYLVGGHDIGREEVGGAVTYEVDGRARAIRMLSRSKSKEFASDAGRSATTRSLAR